MALSVEEFVTRSRGIHGGTYDYSQFVYTNWDTKSTIVCPHHGPFLQKPRQHIERKSGCPICGRKKQRESKRTTLAKFLSDARSVHGYRYDYTDCGFVDLRSPITITCKEHGKFRFDHAYAHTINKNGCPRCARLNHRLTTDQFIEKSTAIHGRYYDYSQSQYTTVNDPVEVICPIHGSQQITPTDHYRVGCWMCKRNRMQDVWLDDVGVPNSKQHRQVRLMIDGRLFIVDGYDPATNTVYLFHGDFWHGNPTIYDHSDVNRRNGKTFGELYEHTKQYEKCVCDAGYSLISIWEYEWLQQKDVLSVTES